MLDFFVLLKTFWGIVGLWVVLLFTFGIGYGFGALVQYNKDRQDLYIKMCRKCDKN